MRETAPRETKGAITETETAKEVTFSLEWTFTSCLCVDLVCGSNNCRKFGLYYHEKDDCCDEPISKQQDKIKCFLFGICGTTTTEDPLFGNYDYGGQAIGIDL